MTTTTAHTHSAQRLRAGQRVAALRNDERGGLYLDYSGVIEEPATETKPWLVGVRFADGELVRMSGHSDFVMTEAESACPENFGGVVL